MKADSFYVGLDIGTNSVGWAVTDTDLNLIKARKQNFWGTRKFDSGETAENRRLYRSSRRRLDRRKQRINLLQQFFANEIKKVDSEFFNKMDLSWVSPDDEDNIKGADFVFGPEQNKDKDLYYSKFPTIWHLRRHLINYDSGPIDIRWIYLALHHIIKYRGNFLYTDSEFKNTESAIEDQFDLLVTYLNETYEAGIDGKSFTDNVKTALTDSTKTLAEKKDQILTDFKPYKDIKSQLTQVANAFLGYSTNFHTIFNYEETVKGYISDDLEDDKYQDLRAHLGPDENILDVLSQIYSWSVLRKLLSDEDNQYISQEMVKQYDEYGQDLKELKELFEKYAKKNKNLFFKSDKEKKNYYHYNLSKKNVLLEELYKTIDKLLPSARTLEKDPRYQRYLQRKADATFLKVQNTTDKGAIPHQLHEMELNKIIENQKKYYPFLNEHKDKITSLLKFRIPYYVGPLNPNSEFAWIERTEEKIHPWNFDEVVDKEASEEEFIHRMVGHCSYLIKEKALPLESLVYQEYILLNEINTVRVNGKILDERVIQDAIEDLFKKNSSVTISKFKRWLEIYFGETQGYQISGLADEMKFNGSLSSWVKFTDIGFDLTNKTEFEMAENIILWATVFSDKNTLKNRVAREYPELTDVQLKQISQMSFKGWGRLSDKLLNILQFTLKDGSEKTILEMMRESNKNFMQIINDKENGIDQQLEEEMTESSEEGSILAQIKDIPGSPAIKKGIHQAVLIVEEISKIMGKEPEKIFLEFARENDEKKRTISRYNRLKEIYDQLKKDNSDYINNEAYKKFEEFKEKPEKLDDERLYLYFMQNGRCLYSGRIIEGNLNSSDYEVDHIMPRSYTKDNSFSNKALVYRTENQRKKDNMLLEESIIDDNYYFWDFLRRKGLMTEKKFRNLTRNHISLNAQKGFINRQLVETRQISKHVKNLLVNLYPDTKVQTLKAQFSSDYRRSKELYKLRSLNDYHHAHDAYLSIFLGEFIERRIPWINNFDPLKKERYDRQVKELFNDKRIFNRKNEYGILELINKDWDKIDWKADEQNKKVERYLNYKDCFVTYKPEERTGEFWKQNAVPIGKGKKYPIKEGLNTDLYGGYTGQNYAYFSLIEISGKIKPIPIPIEISYKEKANEITIEEYIGEIEPKGTVIREKVLVNTKFEYNGHPFIAKSYTERINGKQLLLPKSLQKLLYSVEKNFDYEEKRMDFENYLNFLVSKLKDEFKELANAKGFINIIENNYEEIIALNSDEINHLIRETLYYFQVNSLYPNFKINTIADLKNKTRFGRMSNIISNWKDNAIIDQSITGYYESRLDL